MESISVRITFTSSNKLINMKKFQEMASEINNNWPVGYSAEVKDNSLIVYRFCSECARIDYKPVVSGENTLVAESLDHMLNN